jgi:hypothetical protein
MKEKNEKFGLSMLLNNKICVCPICNGSGKIDTSELQTKKQQWVETKRKMCVDLVRMNYTYRQIAKLVGYKSTRSVAIAIKEALKK